MTDKKTSGNSHNNSTSNVARVLITFSIMAVVALCFWFLLPVIQALILPRAENGQWGQEQHWVVRPDSASHYLATVMMCVLTIPIILVSLQKKWANEAQSALGTLDISRQQRLLWNPYLIVKCSLLLVVYSAALVIYLSSWTIIRPDGIQHRLPWKSLSYSFEDIESLETIPNGARSESNRKNGPWYAIQMRDGRKITLSEDNEGITPDRLRDITTYISEKSGLTWTLRHDVHARRRFE